MREAAAAIRAKSAELLPLVIAETGATATVGSRMQVPVAADRFERYARDPRAVLQTPFVPQTAQATPLAPGGIIGGMVNRQPMGVVACITSYNFPMVNMAGKVAPALAAGNTVVVKPAPQDPLAIVELVRILNDVGFPPGVVNLVNGNTPASSAALVDSDDVDCVSFTGSTQVGVTIGEKAARTMKRTLLELGGKGACVVFEDADVKGGHRLHRLDLVVPLRPDLHGAHPGRRAPQRLRPGAPTAWCRWRASSRSATPPTRRP